MPRFAPPTLLVLVVLAACAPQVRDMSTLALRVGERYGATSTERHSYGGRWDLGLTLTDRRWTGVKNSLALRDSAKAVARLALAQLADEPSGPPDTIRVTFRTVDRGIPLFRVTGSTGYRFAVKDL